MIAPDRWHPTAAHARAVLGGLVLAATAVLARRPDLLVVATPLAGAAVWGALRRPTQVPQVRQELAHPVLYEGTATAWRLRVDDAEGRVDDVAAVFAAPGWTERRPVDGQVASSLRDDGEAPLAVTLRPLRWGRRSVGPVLVVGSSAWAAYRWLGRTETRSLLALPQPAAFDAAAPPVHTPGLVGVSRSPRPGSGTEFARLRPFQPGDRLRRIHWPRSLRTGELHVTETWADHDRQVVLLVDATDDVGESEGVDGGASSLDVAVRAAGAIAEHYAGSGDRVALVAIGGRGVQRVPPATGRRHLRRLLEVLASVEPSVERFDDGRVPRGLDADALVVLLSPLATPASLQRAVAMMGAGRTVVVVDCLPGAAPQRSRSPYVELAWRLRLLEREREVRLAQEAGVAVVPWRGPGSLDAVLRNLQRQTGAAPGRRR